MFLTRLTKSLLGLCSVVSERGIRASALLNGRFPPLPAAVQCLITHQGPLMALVVPHRVPVGPLPSQIATPCAGPEPPWQTLYPMKRLHT